MPTMRRTRLCTRRVRVKGYGFRLGGSICGVPVWSTTAAFKQHSRKTRRILGAHSGRDPGEPMTDLLDIEIALNDLHVAISELREVLAHNQGRGSGGRLC